MQYRNGEETQHSSRATGYFTCNDLMWLTRLEIRTYMIAGSESIDLKSGPHTGISASPCAGAFAPFRSTSSTYWSGNFPPCRFASVVKFAGACFNADAAGPFPFASLPWHTAQ